MDNFDEKWRRIDYILTCENYCEKLNNWEHTLIPFHKFTSGIFHYCLHCINCWKDFWEEKELDLNLEELKK